MILNEIQSKLKAPKNKRNSFGGYNYRSCEDILEALKPILAEYGAQMTISDEMVAVGNRVYVQATVTLRTSDGEYTVKGWAREAETKKGMDDSQITGTASSYARKYALNGMFLIDDTKDADTDEYRTESTGRAQIEAVADMKIGKVKAAAILAYIENNFESVEQVIDWIKGNYNVATVEDLTEAQYSDVFNKLRKKVEKRGDNRQG